ncbi:hypothetical protein COW53_08980 [bacterium CG17_big_fil_post_rev_8_21_14_2_50_64_8]|nr:MAG: hypothetical protein COW53_08980 [bacterium CG17_big_fil_post_rev_8_21_14_2_50_64_8]
MMAIAVVSRFIVGALLSLILFSPPGYGRSWRVEKDGSGDFAVIQNAVDAAAPGDTVVVGPGRYEDKSVLSCISSPEFAYINVQCEDLTLIGSGASQTIVGPEDGVGQVPGYPVGVFASSSCGFHVLEIMNIRIENIWTSVYIGLGSKVTISECEFGGGEAGTNSSCDSMLVRNCEFGQTVGTRDQVISYYQTFLKLDNCRFALSGRQVHVQVQGTPRAEILNCEFVGGFGGGNIVQGGRAAIHNNQFSDQDGFGIAVGSTGGCVASVRDCEFSGQYVAFRQDGGNSVWEVESTTVTDVQVGTLAFGSLNGGYIRDSILAKGERYVVLDYLGLKSSATEPIHFDMTDNWWGTTDPDSIQALIFDYNDDPASGYIIDWQPFKSEPVPTEKKSLGSVKSMFR